MLEKAFAWWHRDSHRAIKEEIREAKGELSHAVNEFERRSIGVQRLAQITLREMHEEQDR